MTKSGNQHITPSEESSTLIKDYPTIRKEKIKFRKELIQKARSKYLPRKLRYRLYTPLSDAAICALKDNLDIEKHKFEFVLENIVTIRKLLSTEKNVMHSTEVVFDCGIPSCILEFLNWDSNKIAQIVPSNQVNKFYSEIMWIVSNIASGTTDQTQFVVSSGCVPRIVDLLHKTSDLSVMDHCIWTLGNISAESVPYRDLVLGLQVLPKLVEILSRKTETTSDLMKTSVWCLKNMLSKYPHPPKKTISMAVPILTTLSALSQDAEVIDDAVDALGIAFHILAAKGVAEALHKRILQ